MTRPLETATKDALEDPVIPLAAIVYLDILGDQLLTWTGIGDLTFGASETGDALLDGNTFSGSAAMLELGSVTDGAGGSSAMEITVSGVDMLEPAARQVITNRNSFRFRKAAVWLVLFDATTGAIVGKPFRIKTGRMDRMPYSEDSKGKATIRLRIESHAAYSAQALNTKWSEQKEIDSADISQDFVAALANMTPKLGEQNGGVSSTGNSAVGRGGGGGATRADRGNERVF